MSLLRCAFRFLPGAGTPLGSFHPGLRWLTIPSDINLTRQLDARLLFRTRTLCLRTLLCSDAVLRARCSGIDCMARARHTLRRLEQACSRACVRPYSPRDSGEAEPT